MKFSLPLLKKFVPGIKNKQQIVDALTMHAFEAADLGGDIIDVSIYPNRFSDAASHFGLARELSAILNLKLNLPKTKFQKPVKSSKKFKILVEDKNLCPRYIGQYFENVKVGPSPKWMQNVLKSCGLRPINNIVDITNYVMLEIGEPMHAFDYDKCDLKSEIHSSITNKKIIIRRAKKGEKIVTLDEEKYDLDEETLVIADNRDPLVIAGIKGGKKAEIDKNTKRIILEAANFDSINIYKTSKRIGLSTDASLRFSHGISKELAILGINRASQLLKEIAGARAGDVIDITSGKKFKKVIRFDVLRFNKFIGTQIDSIKIINILKRLGFNILLDAKNKLTDSFLVEVPLIRTDIEIFEDLAEEVARIIGYDDLKSVSPHVTLKPSGFEDQIILKDKIRDVLTGLGLDEVCNYSFCAQPNMDLTRANTERPRKLASSLYESELVEIENPIAENQRYLRPSLIPLLEKNIFDNFRFFEEVKIFEIGKVFKKIQDSKIKSQNLFKEWWSLGVAIGHKNETKDLFFELKGILEELFKRIGLIDFTFGEKENIFEIYSNNEIIGVLEKRENFSIAEINLEKVLEFIEGEFEYQPLSKYPTVIRDVSVLVSKDIKIGDLMQEIQLVNLSLIKDVDLIDEYEGEKLELNKKSLTFRIIFQADDRTLTDKEVNEQMAKIYSILTSKFKAKIR